MTMRKINMVFICITLLILAACAPGSIEKKQWAERRTSTPEETENATFRPEEYSTLSDYEFIFGPYDFGLGWPGFYNLHDGHLYIYDGNTGTLYKYNIHTLECVEKWRIDVPDWRRGCQWVNVTDDAIVLSFTSSIVVIEGGETRKYTNKYQLHYLGDFDGRIVGLEVKNKHPLRVLMFDRQMKKLLDQELPEMVINDRQMQAPDEYLVFAWTDTIVVYTYLLNAYVRYHFTDNVLTLEGIHKWYESDALDFRDALNRRRKTLEFPTFFIPVVYCASRFENKLYGFIPNHGMNRFIVELFPDDRRTLYKLPDSTLFGTLSNIWVKREGDSTVLYCLYSYSRKDTLVRYVIRSADQPAGQRP